jgi:hypothetical protein
MKQDTLITILRNAFSEGWRERARRLDPDGKIISSIIDDEYMVAQEKVVNHWLKELSSTIEF